MVFFVRFVSFSSVLCAKLELVSFCAFRSVYGCNMFACMLWFSFHWHILLGFWAYSISNILYSAIFNVFLMYIPHRLSKQMRLVSLSLFFLHRTQFMRIYFVLNWTHLARIQRKTTSKSFSVYFFSVDGLPFVLPLFCSSLSWALFILFHCCKRISNNDVKVVFVRRRLVTIGNSDDRFAAQHVRTYDTYTYTH